jgi:hypothetical protein
MKKKAERVFLEIVYSSNDVVARALDVTDRTTSQRERIEAGMNINLDHDRFYTRTTVREEKAP